MTLCHGGFASGHPIASPRPQPRQQQLAAKQMPIAQTKNSVAQAQAGSRWPSGARDSRGRKVGVRRTRTARRSQTWTARLVRGSPRLDVIAISYYNSYYKKEAIIARHIKGGRSLFTGRQCPMPSTTTPINRDTRRPILVLFDLFIRVSLDG